MRLIAAGVDEVGPGLHGDGRLTGLMCAGLGRSVTGGKIEGDDHGEPPSKAAGNAVATESSSVKPRPTPRRPRTWATPLQQSVPATTVARPTAGGSLGSNVPPFLMLEQRPEWAHER